MEEKKERIEIIDAVRGLAILLMVIHHALFNAQKFLDAPGWVYNHPILRVLQIFFVGVFVFVSGTSSRFSRGNIQRGSMVFVVAMMVTYVTVRIVDLPIWFGILHILATFMIFYGFTRKLWDKIPSKIAPFLYIALIVISALIKENNAPTSEIPVVRDLLFVLGWSQEGFKNYDTWGLLPWIFVFLLGTWAGGIIREGRLPKWFYETKVPFFPFLGRHTLIIYVLHQPVLYGITMLLVI
ncbi:MAG: DUF1624 domain-containing protein [Oscillospiraceae bacterium]|nr:DUF1624 domain-containing protein [Oscillospiraceae bacterium]